MRRYTRLSNGFSRKLENHEAAVALNYFAYNFIKIHRTLRVTPALAAKHSVDLNPSGNNLPRSSVSRRKISRSPR